MKKGTAKHSVFAALKDALSAGLVLAVHFESFTGGLTATAGILRADGDIACHTAAVRAVIFAILYGTMNVFDFFLFQKKHSFLFVVLLV